MDATQSTKLIVKIGADSVDLTEYPPITMGDKKRMAKELGFSLKQFSDLNDEQEAAFLHFMLKRVRPGTTIEEVDALPAVLVRDIELHMLKRSSEIDNPFSKRSTSSPASTAGTSSQSSAEVPPSSQP